MEEDVRDRRKERERKSKWEKIKNKNKFFNYVRIQDCRSRRLQHRNETEVKVRRRNEK